MGKLSYESRVVLRELRNRQIGCLLLYAPFGVATWHTLLVPLYLLGVAGLFVWMACGAVFHGLAVRGVITRSDERVVNLAQRMEQDTYVERFVKTTTAWYRPRLSSGQSSAWLLVAFHLSVQSAGVVHLLTVGNSRNGDWYNSVPANYWLHGVLGLVFVAIRYRSLSRWLGTIEQYRAQIGVSVESIPTNVLAATRESV